MITRSVPYVLVVWTLSLAVQKCVGQESGIAKRIPWTTSKFVGTPDPVLPYQTENAFPKLSFNRCIDMASLPGTNQLIVAEQSGKFFSFANDTDVDRKNLMVDLKKEIKGLNHVYAFAFHPEFETNRFIYVCYIKENAKPDGTHIARFKVANSNPPRIDVQSEKTILTFLSGGHNGCCLKFGPKDGYLYISTGDGAGPNPPDTLKAGQDVSNLLSSILRVDVDQDDDGKAYSIPKDNPFVGRPNTREEIWAYGFRNPWRMSFDKKTGDLWVGDVGWELWELMDRVEKGGNYGWSIMEGNQPTNPGWERGPTPILPPTIEHSHNESSSITDGLTYYGNRLKDLQGYHIYSDYDTGKFWVFTFENNQVNDLKEIADTTHRVVGFGEDAKGEFYVLDHIGGTIQRLVKNPEAGKVSQMFPRSLSQSGLFNDVANHELAAGILTYSINAEPWADGAETERFIGVPGTESIKAAGAKWNYPKGTVIGKTFFQNLYNEESNSNRDARRTTIETQIMVFDGTEWGTYTYKWSRDQSDAHLVDSGGDEEELDVVVRENKVGAPDRKIQTWRFSSRSECQRCHNRWSGPVLGFTPVQLERSHPYAKSKASQLETLAHVKILDRRVQVAKKLANPFDEVTPINDRARAYLDVNCAHCHRMHAGGAVLSKMHYDLPLNKTDMFNALPSQGDFGMVGGRVIAPGDAFRSVLYYRMAKTGGGRMPHIGSNEVDEQGLQLIGNWIDSMNSNSEKMTKAGENAKRRREDARELLLQVITGKTKLDDKVMENLLNSTSAGLMTLRAVQSGVIPELQSRKMTTYAATHDNVVIRELFERFLPAEKRVKRLGSVVDASKLLSLPGDRGRGETVFFELATVQCKNCHKVGDRGKRLGPDLDSIGKKYNRRQLLESILDPSKSIEPKYVTHIVQTVDGRIVSGLLRSKNDQEVVVADPQGNEIKIKMEDVEQMKSQRQSIMPELLLRDMTAQQAADLIEYLSSLK